MKKKIIIGLSIISLVFLLGGVYIITTIETTISRLDRLITLHQAEILREHLLIQIERVQSDLGLKGTPYARSHDTIMTNIRNMSKAADICSNCHHSGNILERLTDLKNHIEDYKNSLTKVFTVTNASRLEAEKDNAFRIGAGLSAKVGNMVTITSSKLEAETQSALIEIAHKKTLLFIFIAIGPFLAAGLAFILIRGLTKPVNTLLNATRRLKEGNLDYRIEGLKDEFGEVAASFNEMASAMKKQILNMQRTEQMKMVGELAAGLAHELKNPLAGIKASMEVLAEESTLAEEDRATLLKAIAEIRRIELLMKNLLNFARPPKPQFMAADVNKILDTVIKMLNFSLKPSSSTPEPSKPIDILKDFDKHLPVIMADPMQLQQVALNLLLNAVDAMPDGGTIGVKTSHNSLTHSIQIEVSDTGKGIDKEVIDKIFQPFFTTKAKGTGLGLSITKRLVEEYGGNITVESNSGRGATFRITLPVKQEGVMVA